LDEFVALTHCHRKHAIRLITKDQSLIPESSPLARRTYSEAVREVLVVLWEAADRICGKRLKAVLPDLIAAMERHGHLALDPLIRQQLLTISPATIDRLLRPIRDTAGQRRKPPSGLQCRQSGSRSISALGSAIFVLPQIQARRCLILTSEHRQLELLLAGDPAQLVHAA
jgi:hypothetical protein